MKTVKASFGDECQSCGDREQMLMPRDTRECLREAPRSVSWSRLCTDLLSPSLHLFNVERRAAINVMNGHHKRLNRIFQKEEKREVGELYRRLALSYSSPHFCLNIRFEFGMKNLITGMVY